MFDLNITIVNWMSKKDIDKCLNSLFNDFDKNKLNVVTHVIDNSSNQDGVKDLIYKKYPQVIYIDAGKNIGFGSSQNIGLKNKKAKFYLALNPDVEFLEKGTLEKMIEFLNKNSKVGMVGPKLLNTNKTIQNSCYGFPGITDQFFKRLGIKNKKVNKYLMNNFDHNKTIPVDWLMGSFLMTKQEVVDKIGFFDDRFFMYFEDCDWCRRSINAGWKNFYLSDVKVKHGHARASDSGNLFSDMKNPMAFIHLKSWWRYFRKWNFKKH